MENAVPWLCFGMILSFAGIGVPSPTFAGDPATVAQPLVIEFAYLGGIGQEIAVAEGTEFEVTTRGHGDHLKASGRIGRVQDEQVELVLTLHAGERQNEAGAKGRRLYYESLPLGRFHGLGNVRGNPYLDSVWVRRGVDPVPALLVNLRRLDKNSLLGASYAKKLRGDASGLIPELIRVAQGGDDVVRKASALRDVELQELRRVCATALGHVGQGSPKTARALQTILAGDDDDRLRIAAAISLWKIAKHQDALTFLVGRLSAPDRVSALVALAEIGPEAASSGLSIVPLLNDPAKSTRNWAAWALWRTTRDPRAVHVLIAALKGGDLSAGEKLGLIGYPAARRAAPLLAGMVFREYPYHVAKALRQVDPDARQSLPLIVQEVRRNNGRGADAAGKVLASYGPQLLPALRDLLQEGDEHARGLAISALWHSASDPAAVDTLVDALQHADSKIRRAAASTLGNMEPGGMATDLRPAIPALVKAINDDAETVREAAAVALQEIGPPAVPALQHELKQGNERTRQRAEQILKEIKEIAEMDN
ncbi:MAG: HEAT repeat domain-containing protein [Planctomycetota bacterium]|nr:HEAT repeat domain-containing protein [Planctomycetota bacterium]